MEGESVVEVRVRLCYLRKTLSEGSFIFFLDNPRSLP